jgi:hypothetical protein
MLHERHAKHAAFFGLVVFQVVIARSWSEGSAAAPGCSQHLGADYGHALIGPFMISRRIVRVGVVSFWIWRQFSAVHMRTFLWPLK